MILFTKKNIIADKSREAEQALEELTREIDDALDAIASDIVDVIVIDKEGKAVKV